MRYQSVLQHSEEDCGAARQFRQFHGTTPQVWRNTQRSNISVKQ